MVHRRPNVLSKYRHYLIDTKPAEHTLVFLHIPKCAGSTVRCMFKQHYSEATRTGRDKKIPMEMRERAVVFFGHFEYGDEDYLPYRWPCKNRTHITMLRHPLDRVVSQYWYWKKYHATHGLSILQYSIGKGNLMTQCLAGGDYRDIDQALTNLRKFDCVGITEEFDRSIQLYAKELGWTVGKLEKQNVTEIKPKDAKKALTEHEVTKLLEYNSNDVKLYEVAVKLFHEQCERAEK